MVMAKSLDSFLFYLKSSLTPLPFLSWKLLTFFGASESTPEIFRLGNYLLHALNGLLFYKLAQFLMPLFLKESENDINRLSLFAMTLFLIHPLSVESVVWISSLRGLGATFFALLFLLTFIKLPDEVWDIKNRSLTLAIKSICPALFFLLLSLLFKPTTLPIVFLPLLITLLKKNKIPLSQLTLILGIIALGVIIGFKQKEYITTPYFDVLPFQLRLKLTMASLAVYFKNFFFPFSLTFDHQINPFTVSYLSDNHLLTPLLIGGFVILIAPLVALFKKSLRPFSLIFICSLLLLSPYIGIILYDFNNISVVSDRYAYLFSGMISLFTTITVTFFFQHYSNSFSKFKPQKMKPLLFFLLALLTFRQIKLWQEPTRLLKSSQNYNVLSPIVLIAIGNQYLSYGDTNRARLAFKQALNDNQMAPSLTHLLKLNQLYPNLNEDQFILDYIEAQRPVLEPSAIYPLALLYLRKFKLKEAKSLLESSLQYDNTKRENAIELIQEIKAIESSETEKQFRYLQNMNQIRTLFQKIYLLGRERL